MRPRQTVFVPLHEVIRGNAHKLYGGMRLTGTTLFRLTCDAEVEIDEDSDEALLVVREQIRLRRYEPVVRLEFAPGSNPSIREMLQQRFELGAIDVLYDLPDELDCTSLFQIAALPIPALRGPRGLRSRLQLSKTAPTRLPRSARATSWSIIRTTALKTAWNSSLRPRPAIPRRLR